LEFKISNQKNIIGSFKTNLGDIVGSKNQILSTKIANTSIEMIIQCEELSICKEVLELSLSCNNLKNVRTGFLSYFKNNRCYIALSRSRENMSYVRIFKTENVKSSNPIFEKFKISAQSLCNGDIYRPVKIEAYHEKSGDNDRKIGEFITSMKELRESRNNTSYLLKNNNETVGKLKLDKCLITSENSFLD